MQVFGSDDFLNFDDSSSLDHSKVRSSWEVNGCSKWSAVSGKPRSEEASEARVKAGLPDGKGDLGRVCRIIDRWIVVESYVPLC